MIMSCDNKILAVFVFEQKYVLNGEMLYRRKFW